MGRWRSDPGRKTRFMPHVPSQGASPCPIQYSDMVWHYVNLSESPGNERKLDSTNLAEVMELIRDLVAE